MSKTAYSLETVGMGVCIGYTIICWVADLAQIGNMPSGSRCNLLFPGGIASITLGLAASAFAYRHRRVMARMTFGACLLWVVWSLLPRL